MKTKKQPRSEKKFILNADSLKKISEKNKDFEYKSFLKYIDEQLTNAAMGGNRFFEVHYVRKGVDLQRFVKHYTDLGFLVNLNAILSRESNDYHSQSITISW